MAQTVFLALILKQLTYPDSLIYAQDYCIFYHTLLKKKQPQLRTTLRCTQLLPRFTAEQIKALVVHKDEEEC